METQVNSLKQQANQLFESKQYDQSIALYLDAIALLPARLSLEDQDETQNHSQQDPAISLNGKQKQDTNEQDQAINSNGKQEQDQTINSNGKQEQDQAINSNGKQKQDPDSQIQLQRATLYSNLAACYLKQENYKQAVISCNQALLDHPNYVKPLYRRAQANEKIGNWSALASALDDNKKLITLPDLLPSTKPTVLANIKRLEPLVEQAAIKEKDEMLEKLKGVGDSLLGTFGLSTKNFKFTQQPGGGYSFNFVQ